VEGSVSLVALLCRTSDRTARAGLGVQELAARLGERLGVEPRPIGSPGDARAAGYEDDLRDSRGCILEAGGQVEDALSGGNRPLLLAGECSVALTTLPTALRLRPEAKVLWLDAHGDFNTPETSTSRYLGGMSLSAACGEWDSGFGDSIRAERVVMAGVRQLDPGERELLERSEATVVGASTVETLVAVKNALDGAPVYVHLDVDVLDPEAMPAQFPVPGGLSADKLYDLFEAVAEDSDLVGLEVTALELPEDPEAVEEAVATVLHVVEPLLQSLGDSVPAG
jgi:arginase family enzyme